MDILFLLVPVSVILALAILGVFAWALQAGQFDDLEQEGQRVLADPTAALELAQTSASTRTEESS